MISLGKKIDGMQTTLIVCAIYFLSMKRRNQTFYPEMKADKTEYYSVNCIALSVIRTYGLLCTFTFYFFALSFFFFTFYFLQMYCPMGNSGCFPRGKPAAAESRYHSRCILGVSVFP